MAKKRKHGHIPGQERNIKADMNRPPALSIAVCYPARTQVETGFSFDLAQCYGFTAAALVASGIANLKLYTTAGTYIDQSRYHLTRDTLKDGATHLMWFDADMRFPEDTILRLLKHREPIVGANYVQRVHPHEPITFKEIREDGNHTRCWTEEDSTGLEEVQGIGFGCVLIQAQVFEVLGPECFNMSHFPHFVGEDIWFCNMARAAGYKVYIDHDLSKEVKHVGQMEFRHEHGRAIRTVSEPKTESRIILPDADEQPRTPGGLVLAK